MPQKRACWYAADRQGPARRVAIGGAVAAMLQDGHSLHRAAEYLGVAEGTAAIYLNAWREVVRKSLGLQ